MLDRNKLLKEFNKNSISLFPDNTAKINLAYDIWQEISNNVMFAQKAVLAQSSFLIPSWTENLNSTFEIKTNLKEYSVLSIDGSQIYPDRHMPGSHCSLLNIGGVLLKYGAQSSVQFFSEPTVLIPNDESNFSKDLIDLKREEMEFEKYLMYFLS